MRLLLALAAFVLVVSGCRGDDMSSPTSAPPPTTVGSMAGSTTTTTTEALAPTTVAPNSATTAPPTTVTTAGSIVVAGGVLPVASVVASTVDYAFFLGGLEADLAAEAAGDIAPGEGVPNDFFIVNENPRLRTFPLASDIELLLLGYRDDFESIPAPPSVWFELRQEADRCQAADWPADCAGLGGDDWSWFGSGTLPFWIQLDGDTVVRIEEQYLP